MENEFFLWFCLAVLTIMGVLSLVFFYSLGKQIDKSTKGTKGKK